MNDKSDELHQKLDERRDQILNGSIIKTLIYLGWPVALSNIFQTIYNFANTFWVTQLGEYHVGATTLAFPLMFLFMSIAIGLSSAGSSLTSQYFGAKQEQERDQVIAQFFSFMLIASVLIAIFGSLFTEELLSLLGGAEEVLSLAETYLRTIFLGMPALFMWFTFSSVLRAHGDTKMPMILNGATMGLNLILDPLLIFGVGPFPEWGLFGAAITDVIGRIFASSIGLGILISGKRGFQLHLKFLVPKLRWIKKFISIGVPSSVGLSLTAIGATVLTALISRAGPKPLAIYGIGSRLTRMSNMVIWGITAGLSPMIGQNLGADQRERSHKILREATLAVFGLTLILSFFLYGFRGSLFRLFTSNDDIIRGGKHFLSIFVFSVPFFAVYRAINSMFQGAGHTKHLMVLSIIRLWGFRVTLTFLLYYYFHWGVTGIWVGIALGNFLGAGVSLLWTQLFKWDVKVIDKEAQVSI